MIPWAKGSIEIKIHKVTDKDNVLMQLLTARPTHG